LREKGGLKKAVEKPEGNLKFQDDLSYGKL